MSHGDQLHKQRDKICLDLSDFLKTCAKHYTNDEICLSILIEGSLLVWWWELLCTMILMVIMWYKGVWDKNLCYIKYGKCFKCFFFFFFFLPSRWMLCYSTTANNSSFVVLIYFVKYGTLFTLLNTGGTLFLFLLFLSSVLKGPKFMCDSEAYIC